MTNIELRRNHEGKVDLFVGGIPALGARMTIMQATEDGMTAFFAIPLKNAVLGEASTVISFQKKT